MKKTVRKLQPEVVSQIAAGEVIERPASALKELLENALDAGATKIVAQVSEGGIRRLAVVDNGRGISKADMPLAVSPHATSKLAKLSDLEKIETMGFRGEALSSIAASGSLTLRSRTASEPNGYELRLQGVYAQEDPKPTPMAAGTEVIIEDLFAQLPVRRKFLRKPPTEWAHCETAFQSFAVSCPDIELILQRDKSVRMHLPPQSRSERVVAVYGSRFAENMQTASIDLGPLKADVYIAPGLPVAGFRSKAVLNGRTLSDKLLRQAVRRGVSDVLRGPEPAYAIYLQIPPALFDVNAHPAKHEVRFREPQAIFKFVMDAVEQAVSKPVGNVRPLSIAVSGKRSSSAVDSYLPPAQFLTSTSQAPAQHIPAHAQPEALRPDRDEEQSILVSGLGRPLGQVHGVYMLAETEQGLVIIDIHAAHERLLYEKLKQVQDASPQSAQLLLTPAEVDLSPAGLDAVASNREQLGKIGFELRNSDGAEMLFSLPATIADRVDNPAALATTVIEEIAETGIPAAADQIRDKLLATLACHAAVRGKIPQLSMDEMQELLRSMEDTMRSGVCNHGRPCLQLLQITQLDRMFMRGR